MNVQKILVALGLVLVVLLAFVVMSGCVDEAPATSRPPDEWSSGVSPDVDDGYVPKPVTAARLGIFYQITGDVLDLYEAGLPSTDNHAWLITQSHGTVFATRTLADRVHARADFYYAPAFDVWDASHDGWEVASDAQLATWAHQFRDAAIAAHADLFTFNEVPSNADSDAGVRVQIARILRHLHEPDAKGRRLSGVVYFTEHPGTAANWHVPASDFFAAIDETAVALVVEHYHSNGFICGQTEAALATHYFAMRDWLAASGEAAKISIANTKYAVLHSARYAAGDNGWSGGDSDHTTLADYQRALSRAAKVTRDTVGGYNRLAFGPVTTSLTAIGVMPRIVELFKWHYAAATTQLGETACVAGSNANCTCQ